MKLPQFVFFALAIMVAPFAFAARVVFNPPSQVGGGGPPQSGITTTSFSFISPSGTSPGTSACVINGVDDDVCDFLNISGLDWTHLQFTASPGDDLSSCQPLYGFTNCDVDQQGGPNSPTVFTLFGGTGVPDGVAFEFAVQGWLSNTEFDVVANSSAPEPSTTGLFLAGLLFVILLSRRAPLMANCLVRFRILKNVTAVFCR